MRTTESHLLEQSLNQSFDRSINHLVLDIVVREEEVIYFGPKAEDEAAMNAREDRRPRHYQVDRLSKIAEAKET